MDYTHKNLNDAFNGTYLKGVIDNFLAKYTPKARNPNSGRLLLLEVLESYEPI
jgi:hypothetical protein